jgi:serine protease AprX
MGGGLRPSGSQNEKVRFGRERTFASRGAAAGAAIVGALALASAASAGPSKIDPRLTALAREAPRATLTVLVFGSEAEAGAATRRVGGQIVSRFELLPVLSARVPAPALARLAAEPAVTAITLDAPVVPTASPRDATATFGAVLTESGPTAPSGSALASLYPQIDGALAAWDAGLTGRGVGIAVVDTGAVQRGDFAGRLTQPRCGGLRTSPDDSYGHGTFVTGIAGGNGTESAGAYVGIAPGANLVAVNVADGQGGTRTSDVIRGLDCVVANRARLGIRVVNLSVQETIPGPTARNPLVRTVERLSQLGLVVVVSAGNLGEGSVSYAPANAPSALTVGATDTNGTLDPADDRIASWSSRGVTLEGLEKPELVAPGRNIVSTLPPGSRLAYELPDHVIAPGYGVFSGTSFSAPQVAGAAALLLEAEPRLAPNQMKTLLASTARRVDGARGVAIDAALAALKSDSWTKTLSWNRTLSWNHTLSWNKTLSWNGRRAWEPNIWASGVATP